MNEPPGLERDVADIAVADDATGGALDQHDHAAGGVGADDARVGTHPIIRMGWPLLGWQQRNGGLQRVQTEALARRQVQFGAKLKF